jgi:hypothetical protein
MPCNANGQCGSWQWLSSHPQAGSPGSDSSGSGRPAPGSDGTASGGYPGDGMLTGHLGIEPTGPTAALYREMTKAYTGGWKSFLAGIGDSLVGLLDMATTAADPAQGLINMLSGNTWSDRYTHWMARHGVQTGANSEYGAGIGVGAALQAGAGSGATL